MFTSMGLHLHNNKGDLQYPKSFFCCKYALHRQQMRYTTYMDIHIAILIGTTRAQRKSVLVAHFLQSQLNMLDGVSTVLVDPLDFTFNGDGNDPEGKDPKYTKKHIQPSIQELLWMTRVLKQARQQAS
ncbi:hypothetical protein EB118_16875 [bacterium]|nr:hypothetical protein [bacterium]